MSVRSLVPDIWITIFGMLPIRELWRLAQTCSMMKELVETYKRSAFNFPGLLQPFIHSEHVDSFREMLHVTGGVISGSIVLQYLERVRFESSDLDIYVFRDKQADAVKWLQSHGLTRMTSNRDVDVSEEYDVLEDVESVESFVVPDSLKIVQIISTRRNPVIAVLKFHSCTLLKLFPACG